MYLKTFHMKILRFHANYLQNYNEKTLFNFLNILVDFSYAFLKNFLKKLKNDLFRVPTGCNFLPKNGVACNDCSTPSYKILSTDMKKNIHITVKPKHSSLQFETKIELAL